MIHLLYPIIYYTVWQKTLKSHQLQWTPFTGLAGSEENFYGKNGTQQSVHSFIHLGYFYCASSSPLLLRSAPDTARILCRSFTPKSHRQLRVKDLPKVRIGGAYSGIRPRDPSHERRRI